MNIFQHDILDVTRRSQAPNEADILFVRRINHTQGQTIYKDIRYRDPVSIKDTRQQSTTLTRRNRSKRMVVQVDIFGNHLGIHLDITAKRIHRITKPYQGCGRINQEVIHTIDILFLCSFPRNTIPNIRKCELDPKHQGKQGYQPCKHARFSFFHRKPVFFTAQNKKSTSYLSIIIKIIKISLQRSKNTQKNYFFLPFPIFYLFLQREALFWEYFVIP